MEYPDTIRRATPSDLPALSETLADALQDDPVISWLFPSEHDRRQRAKRFFMWTLSRTSMPLGEVWMDEECQAAALWAPPDRWRLSPRDQVGLLPSAAALFKGRTPRILVGFNKVEARHPKDPPHWYLYFIGTQTARQGHGFGGALLRHMLARCDEENLARDGDLRPSPAPSPRRAKIGVEGTVRGRWRRCLFAPLGGSVFVRA